LSQNVVHSDSDLILHNSSVLIDKEPCFLAEFWFCLPYSNNPFLIQNHHTIEFLFMQAFSYKK
ncbi:hypothetical protein ACYIMI_09865, partial [Enterococcus faecium]